MNKKGSLNHHLLFFTRSTLVFLLILLLLRIVEYFSFDAIHSVNNNFWEYPAEGLLSDLIFGCGASAVLFIPFFLLSFLSARAGRSFLVIFQIILLLFSAMLAEYFVTTLAPLGEILFITPWNEVKHIVFSSVNPDLRVILILLIPLLFVPIWFAIKKITGPRIILPMFLLIIAGAILEFSYKIYNIENFSSSLNYYQSISKPSYLLKESYDYYIKVDRDLDFNSPEFREIIKDYHQKAVSFETDDERFPMWHKAGKPEDVLGPFMNLKAQPPIIVFLIVEGLGGAISGDNSYLGSFTPFLDSLANHSLYWPNFIGNGQRTFAAIPSATGALPFGREGFTEQREEMPRHLSLYSILKKNNYHTGFFYAGWAGFTSMDYYFQYHNVDLLVEDVNFPDSFSKHGYVWGYHDEDLYLRYFQMLDSLRNENVLQPLMNTLLTLSTHEPFRVPGIASYIERVEQMVDTSSINEKYKESILQGAGIYASYLYADKEIQDFIEEYKKRPDYENTVFFIFGDHRMTASIRDEIDMYHVPLLVYSPLLKRSKKMAAINSQRNLMPTVLNLMHQKFAIDLPPGQHWFDLALDTVAGFRNIHQIPLMTTERTTSDFIDGLHFITGDILHQINPDMSLTRLPNDSTYQPLRKQIRRKADLHQIVGEYVCVRNRLIPKEVMDEYLSPRVLFDGKDVLPKKIKFNEDKEWDSIYSRIPVPDDALSFVEISFDVATDDPGQLPLIVFQVNDKNNKQLEWLQIEVKDRLYGPEGGPYRFLYKHIIKPKQGMTHNIRCLIWSHKKSEFTLLELTGRVYTYNGDIP
ncbi:MAG: LTA synthase family protein [Bacteroidia bacterium]